MPGKLDGLANTASALVTDFGKTATLTRVTKTSSAATGKSTVSTATETVIVTPPVPPSALGAALSRLGGTSAEVGQFTCAVAANDVAEPAIGDRLTIDGRTYQIIAVTPVYAGEVAALYEMELRA